MSEDVIIGYCRCGKTVERLRQPSCRATRGCRKTVSQTVCASGTLSLQNVDCRHQRALGIGKGRSREGNQTLLTVLGVSRTKPALGYEGALVPFAVPCVIYFCFPPAYHHVWRTYSRNIEWWRVRALFTAALRTSTQLPTLQEWLCRDLRREAPHTCDRISSGIKLV